MAAVEIHDAPEHKRPGIRTLLETYLLADADPCVAVKRISLPADVVEAYARIFFDVGPRLRAGDWVAARVLCGGAVAAYGGSQAACVRYCGYSGGAAVAAVVWSVLADLPVPIWVPDRERYDSKLAREEVRLTVAMMTATTPQKVAAVVRMMRSVRRWRARAATKTVANTTTMLDLQERFLVSPMLLSTRLKPEKTPHPTSVFPKRCNKLVSKERRMKNPKRVAAGKRNRRLRKGLTAEGREKLRQAAWKSKPWTHATGPRTPQGKAKVAKNGAWRQAGEPSLRALRRGLRVATAEVVENLILRTPQPTAQRPKQRAAKTKT